MLLIDSKSVLEETLKNIRGEKTIALVPTMGNLHQGHLSLIHTAKQHADFIVVTIFINPTQFAPTEDFAQYPRTLTQDQEKLKSLNCEILFMPTIEEIYPEQPTKTPLIDIPSLMNTLCGQYRPNHFQGVATVVTKLFNLVRPNFALFGTKDLQQLTIIKYLVKNLFFPISIIDVATVREKDGLALSSRNQYLTPPEREQATQLYQSLRTTHKLISNLQKPLDIALIINHCNQIKQQLSQLGFKVDYYEVRNVLDLSRPNPNNNQLVILTAAWLNNTRLIDNLTLEI